MSQHTTLQYWHFAAEASHDLRHVSNIYDLKASLVICPFFDSWTNLHSSVRYLGSLSKKYRADTTAYQSQFLLNYRMYIMLSSFLVRNYWKYLTAICLEQTSYALSTLVSANVYINIEHRILLIPCRLRTYVLRAFNSGTGQSSQQTDYKHFYITAYPNSRFCHPSSHQTLLCQTSAFQNYSKSRDSSVKQQ